MVRSIVVLFPILLLFFLTDLATCKPPQPFVVLPPFLRLNATNSITVTPVKTKSDNVDIQISVTGVENGKPATIFTQKLKAKKSGSPHSVSFSLRSTVAKARVYVDVVGHDKFETDIAIKPDISALHLHTDKNIYAPGETVSLRALPLTEQGAIYSGSIEFTLVNPDGFELLKKEGKADNNIIASEFQLPEHLFFGEWRVVARPKGFRDPEMAYDTLFQVKDYVLPPFKIVANVEEGKALDSTVITVNANYFYGVPVTGSLSVFCSPHQNNENHVRSSLVLQSQTSDSTYIEGPSPERQSTRIQPATVTTLREIHDNFVPRAYYQSNFYPDYGIGSTTSYSNAGIRYYETTGPPEFINSSARFLELPAPYHYLPDTPYFRRAPIIPPPVNNSQGVVPLQRIINRYVTSMKISNGFWQQAANLTMCFSADYKKASTITVEIRDRGTGSRGEAQVKYDAFEPNFEIVPQRPAYNAKATQLLFVLRSTGAKVGTLVSATFFCLGENIKRISQMVDSAVGDIIVFQTPAEWRRCSVIMVQAARGLNSQSSRLKSVMLPNLDTVNSYEASWIKISNPQPTYKVGDRLVVKIDGNIAKELNFMVLCNSQSVRSIGQLRDDGSLSIEIVQSMIGRCILFVYSTTNRPTTDMVQFDVDDICKSSTTISTKELGPGENVTLTLTGDRDGMAVLRAIDDRLNSLATNPEYWVIKSWDFRMFHKPENKGNQAKLINFIDTNEVRIVLEKNCETAGTSYFMLNGACPEVKLSVSSLSNFCLRVMVNKCLNPQQPTVSSSCDPKNPNSCGVQMIQSRVRVASFVVSPKKTEQLGANMFSDMPDPVDDPRLPVRHRFHEVWLFEAFPLGSSGSTSVSVAAPDTIGRWSISAVFWSPGRSTLCKAPEQSIIAKKDVFMDVDLPQHVYINETITVKVSVTALKIDGDSKFAICHSELSRKVCADLGSFGQHGRPAYTRVSVSKENPVDTKTFTMRFLATGTTRVKFDLRREATFPGKHQCEVGEIMDSVMIKLHIAQRAETEDHYKRLMLDAGKPLARVFHNDALIASEPDRSKDIIEVHEFRSLSDPSTLVSEIHANMPDTDNVYSFSVDISKFLPNRAVIADSGRSRSKRGVLEYGNPFLSDVLKKLSSELYLFKRLRQQRRADAAILETTENKIGSLISDMLRFSDCRSETACGYSEFGKPENKSERSLIMTAISSSLLCEASADERLVCGGLSYLMESIARGLESINMDYHELIDLEKREDRVWFMHSLLLQVLRDCTAYRCPNHDDAIRSLFRAAYNLDESHQFDGRTVAALAFMGTNATSELMRIRMLDDMKTDMIPFWSAGHTTKGKNKQLSQYEEVFRQKKMKSGDVLVNSLGVLAFISAGAEGKNVEWDPLANWLYEQQQEDGTFDNAIDTYFASRALYEYRYRKVDIESQQDLLLTIKCSGCTTKVLNVTETSSEVYLPTHIRNVTLITKGSGKIKAGIRIVASKRQRGQHAKKDFRKVCAPIALALERDGLAENVLAGEFSADYRSRRGLTQDDYYPVRMTVTQDKVSVGSIKQTVCLKVLSPILDKIEMTHGLYTGYRTSIDRIGILGNSTAIRLVRPALSSYAAHFLLEGFSHGIPLCYELGITEPPHTHEPFNLAPVALTARHPINDVVGLVLIVHPDQRRPRRSIMVPPEIADNTMRKRRDTSRRRFIRNIVDESIDTVCHEGGSCSCAETSCGVQCGLCSSDNKEALVKTLNQEDMFGVLATITQSQKILIGDAYYHRMTTRVTSTYGDMKSKVSENLIIWLRECNPRCLSMDKSADKVLMMGDASALTVDAQGFQHYVLRDSDRLEHHDSRCATLSTLLFYGE